MTSYRPHLLLVGLMLTVACGDKDAPKGGDEDGQTDDTGIDNGKPDDRTDLDHDGYFSDVDCNDRNYQVYPEAAEICDEVDNNCDGDVDEGFDRDGDGYLSIDLCDIGDDCDDADSRVNPGAAELPYDGEDQDCNGEDSLDADLDGYDDIGHGGNDCDDTEDTVYPGAPEVAKDGIDQNCDDVDLLDGDLDGYDDEDFGGDDCDDTDPAISPGAFDWLNDGFDTNCDGRDGARIDLASAPATVQGAPNTHELVGAGLVSCDLNGDGDMDLAVGAPFAAGTVSTSGEVGIWFGGDISDWTDGMMISSADVMIEGSESYGYFGLGLLCEDVDADGIDDLLVASGEESRSTDGWSLHVFAGEGIWSSSLTLGDATAVLTHEIGVSTSSVVYSMEMLPWDTDGDGTIDELLVAKVEGPSSYQVQTIWGIEASSLLASGTLADAVSYSITLDQTDSLMSWAVAPDLNSDGYTELAIGQDILSGSYHPGRVSFISGPVSSNGAVDALAFATLEGPSGVEASFGAAIAFGDYDGDASTDAAITLLDADRGGSSDVGAIYYYSDIGADLIGGGLDGVSLAEGNLLGEWNQGYLGVILKTIGDIDSDGKDDLFAWEPYGGATAQGRVRIIGGDLLSTVASTDTIVDNVQIIELRPDTSYQEAGLTSTFDDLDGDGTPDPVIGARSYGRTSSSAGYYTGRVFIFTSTGWGL